MKKIHRPLLLRQDALTVENLAYQMTIKNLPSVVKVVRRSIKYWIKIIFAPIILQTDLALTSLKDKENLHFEYLDDDDLQNQILFFRSPNISRVRFDLPTIHCAACIWLLENLPRLT